MVLYYHCCQSFKKLFLSIYYMLLYVAIEKLIKYLSVQGTPHLAGKQVCNNYNG